MVDVLIYCHVGYAATAAAAAAAGTGCVTSLVSRDKIITIWTAVGIVTSEHILPGACICHVIKGCLYMYSRRLAF